MVQIIQAGPQVRIKGFEAEVLPLLEIMEESLFEVSFLEKDKGERFPKYLKYDAEIKRRTDFILDSKAAN